MKLKEHKTSVDAGRRDPAEYLAHCIACWNGQHDQCEPSIARGEGNARCICWTRNHQAPTASNA